MLGLGIKLCLEFMLVLEIKLCFELVFDLKLELSSSQLEIN